MPPSPEAKTNERPPQTPDQSSRLAIASSGGAALANDRIGDIPMLRAGVTDVRKPGRPGLVGRAMMTHQTAREVYRPWVAGIIGAGRSWTAWTISVLSIPRR